MKKIIKWLAEVTGVAKEIRTKAYKDVGHGMRRYAYWFTGGILVEGHKYDISNILYEYPNRCLFQGSPHLYGNQFDDLRQELWKLSDENKSIIVELDKKTFKNEIKMKDLKRELSFFQAWIIRMNKNIANPDLAKEYIDKHRTAEEQKNFK